MVPEEAAVDLEKEGMGRECLEARRNETTECSGPSTRKEWQRSVGMADLSRAALLHRKTVGWLEGSRGSLYL